MYRSFPRSTVVAILALVLGLAVLAPAAALPKHTQLSTADTASHWIAAAWEALRIFLAGAPLRPASAASNPSPPLSPPASPGGGFTPMTGACIDPMGRPVPCNP